MTSRGLDSSSCMVPGAQAGISSVLRDSPRPTTVKGAILLMAHVVPILLRSLTPRSLKPMFHFPTMKNCFCKYIIDTQYTPSSWSTASS